VEAPVETDTPQFRPVPLRGLDHRHRMVHVRPLPHHPVMQDEAMPVLRDAHRNARPDRRSGPALRDPPGMGLEDREHLLLLRNLPALKQPAVDRVNLLLRRVREMPVLRSHGGFGCPGFPTGS